MPVTPNKKKRSPSRRRTQEERRAETSDKLLKATIELLLEKGYSKFRIADASARAKVSRGGQTHHYATKNELIEAAIDRLFVSEVSQARFDAANTPDSSLIRCAADHAEAFLTTKLYKVCLNLLISAGEQEELADGVRAISARSRAPIEEAWLDRVVQSGISGEDAKAILSLLWSVQRGLKVRDTIEREGNGDSEEELAFAIKLLNDHCEVSAGVGVWGSTADCRRTGRSKTLIKAPSRPPVSKQRQIQDRSAATQGKLLDATCRILRKVGHAGLRSANVAKESGVSLGGMLHHYPTKEGLVAAVFERLSDNMEEESWRRINCSSDDEVLDAIVEDARYRFLGDSYKVMLDIHIACAKEKPFEKIKNELAERHQPNAREGWARRLAATGVDAKTADQVTRFLWNMVKGIAVRNLVQCDESLNQQVIALALDLARRQCGDAARPA